MIRLWLFLALLAVIIPDFASAAVAGPARVQFMTGDVLFRAEEDDEWLPASVNTPLYEGDTLWCPEGSKVEVQFAEGSIVRLDSGSQLNILDNEDDFIHLYLAKGRLYLSTAKTHTINSLQIDADDTTVLPAENTRLRLDMLSGSQEDVAVLKGSAYVEGNGNRTRVHAGEHIALEEDRSELLPLNLPDTWETWNRQRDLEQARLVSADNYLPEELQSYAGELNANGTWVRVPEYGMVWQPSVVASAQWSPYTNGRWVWRGNDYVWIPFDAWGWVPFHFGRWSTVTGHGWCWVPPTRGDVYWGPGYVGWYRTGRHVGWTPLAPGEMYYGHGRYGRHSMNVTNTTMNVTTIEYKNRHARGGMTIVEQKDFLKGKVIRSSPVKSSVPLTVSTGSPRIKPLRETRMPVVKQVPPEKFPGRSDYQANRDLRQRFPKVKDERSHGTRVQQSRPVPVSPATPAVGSSPHREIRPIQKPPSAEPQTAAPPAAAAAESRPQVQRTVAPPVAAQRNDAQRGDKQQRESKQRDARERKVWRVKTPDNDKGGTPPAKENKIKETKPKPVKDKEPQESGRKEK